MTRSRFVLTGGTVQASPTPGGCDAQQGDLTGSTSVWSLLVRGFPPLASTAPGQSRHDHRRA
ncbi:hypothetical protein ACFQ1S_16855, partial [Kibdelosporangium lantanae]